MIVEGVLILTRPDAHVRIRLPRRPGWYGFEFAFGNRFARFEDKQDTVWYVPVQRE